MWPDRPSDFRFTKTGRRPFLIHWSASTRCLSFICKTGCWQARCLSFIFKTGCWVVNGFLVCSLSTSIAFCKLCWCSRVLFLIFWSFSFSYTPLQLGETQFVATHPSGSSRLFIIMSPAEGLHFGALVIMCS